MIYAEADAEGEQYGNGSSGEFWSKLQNDIFLDIHFYYDPFFRERSGFFPILSNIP